MKITLIDKDNGSGKETLAFQRQGIIRQDETETSAYIHGLWESYHCWKVRMPDTNIDKLPHIYSADNIPVPKRANWKMMA